MGTATRTNREQIFTTIGNTVENMDINCVIERIKWDRTKNECEISWYPMIIVNNWQEI